MERVPVPPRLLDQVRTRIRYLHYSRKTEHSYISWIKRYIYFHNKTHPREMREPEIEAFLNFLACKQKVAASTQNQALNAILFLYKQVLNIEIDRLQNLQYAKRPKHLPVVLTGEEALALVNLMTEPYRTMSGLMYGSDLRLMECLRLRILDLDFSRKEIFIRSAKGGKDRVTVMPESSVAGLQHAIQKSRQYFERDMAAGIKHIDLPFALAKKYPNAARELKWQYVFPSWKLSVDPRSGRQGRHHIDESAIRKSLRKAVKQSGIMKHVSCHTFRHSFATHMLERGYDIRTVQELLGHKHVNTTMIYTHVLNRGGRGVKSPLDSMQ